MTIKYFQVELGTEVEIIVFMIFPSCGLIPKWKKGGKPVAAGEQLLILNVNKSHSGNYTVKAENGVGTWSKKFVINVESTERLHLGIVLKLIYEY